MIEERLEEQACLFALGCLPAEEYDAFEIELHRNVELQSLVVGLRASAAAVAGNISNHTPPPALKDKVMAQINASEKIVPLPKPEASMPPVFNWLPWALAACLAILCGIFVQRENTLKSRIAELNQMADTLQSATNNLQQTILALQETNRLADMRIAMLGSLLEDQPKAVAVSLWDEDHQTGVFVVQNLKPSPADKDYQLWVIDPQYGTPVDAGIFQVDDKGQVRFQFKAKQHIKTAGKFAVTQEVKGGSPTPKGQMVLIGG